ncbi:Carbon-nitrogen hydrolase [Pedococcus dokdonensis]|uniref:Carbon-nitrogen hydrolase n=1 Tax=Pedococcus dokdonensis TaxID=443156 RepID=A0A1H0TVY8_9MICO|nr:carbon-nitrogen family hydrolase [Pedococcus dokdonensis]SDP57910.1 Carbon-nitrogen hydrolase [Pedococcus dokdonensis]
MRVAVLQVAYGDDEPMSARVERVAALVREQAGHDLVVLPELWAPGGFSYREWADRAQPVDGSIGSAMSAAARDAGVLLHAGSIIERGVPGETGGDTAGEPGGADPRSSEGRHLWNTSLVFGPDGALVASYRKIHRFGFGSGEPKLLDAGEDIVVVDLPGNHLAGLSTCYDLRFPELYRRQLDAGATVFVVPAAWPAARVRHWTLLAHARAVENQCVVIACNTAGTHAGTEMGGHSQVISATGEALAMAGTAEEVLSVEVDMDAVTTWRTQFPVLGDRRL